MQGEAQTDHPDTKKNPESVVKRAPSFKNSQTARINKISK